VLFTSKDDALNFRKGAASRAKSKEKDFENVYFSLYVGLQTRVRVEVSDTERMKIENRTIGFIEHIENSFD
jgi:hypothetical protein